MKLDKEKQIIEASKSDKKAFAPVYEEYSPHVYRYAYSIVQDKSKAQDITQEAFTRALDKLDEFEWRGISIKNWLIRFARFIAYEGFDVKTLPGEELIEDYPDVRFSDQEINVGLKKDLTQALEQLPVTTREIIVLKIWEEYKFVEISELIDMNENTVKSHFYRGIRELQSILEKKGYDKQFVIFPILFSGLSKIGGLSNLGLPSQLSGVSAFDSILSKFSSTNKMKVLNYTLSKPLVLGSVAMVGIAAIGFLGYAAYDEYVREDEIEEDREESIIEEEEGEEEIGEPEVSDEAESTESGQAISSTAPDPYSGWETYTNSLYGYSIKYPSTWSVRELPVNICPPEVVGCVGVTQKGEIAEFTEVGSPAGSVLWIRAVDGSNPPSCENGCYNKSEAIIEAVTVDGQDRYLINRFELVPSYVEKMLGPNEAICPCPLVVDGVLYQTSKGYNGDPGFNDYSLYKKVIETLDF